MLKGSKTEISYDDIDYEISELVRLINNVEGIETIESCCGHSKRPCRIWFIADNVECVTKFIYRYLYNNSNWRVVMNISDVEIDTREWGKPTYLLETTIPYYSYTELAIANLIYHIKSEDSKDQYEVRLKADMVAMLREIQLQMEEYEPKWAENDEQAVASCRTWDDLDEIIQQKIDSLKEVKDGGN